MTVTIAIIGGKLQGVEAVYLAHKAGFNTLVIDKNPDAPAAKLCDRFLEFAFETDDVFPKQIEKPDLILPAIEDDDVLPLIQRWAVTENIPLAFDPHAYAISSSKLKSDAMFQALGLPAPKTFPACEFPVVVKPDQASGSEGVEIFNSKGEFLSRFPDGQGIGNRVVQEYVEGPSYSIEVIGSPGQYMPLQVTDLGMDEEYDCNRVTAPTDLPADQIREFEEMAVAIAEEIRLKGIMDVEVILHKGELKLLEIDARLPSQTPMAVYWSTGLNMVEMLAALFLGNPLRKRFKDERPALVEHIEVTGSKIKFLGEHIMGQHGPLHLEKDFFGADEAVTSFGADTSQWVATLVFTGQTPDEIDEKRAACLKKILNHEG